MEKINVMAKEDMIEDVRAVYGDCTAEQQAREAYKDAFRKVNYGI